MRYLVAIWAIAATVPAAAVLAQQYQLVDLGAITALTTPASINSAGAVAGWSMQADSAFRAVRWDGSLVNLGPVAGFTQSTATVISDDGSTFGTAYSLGNPVAQAVRFGGSTPTVLGEFAPRGVNGAGDVVGRATGTSTDGLFTTRACLYQGGALTALPSLGGLCSDAFDINVSGRIVGSAYLAGDRFQRPTLWIGGVPIDLGTLAGAAVATGQAKALNDAGTIVGWSTGASGIARATLFRTTNVGVVTSRVDLGVLASGSSSFANAINASEQVVGTSDWRAFLWSAGTMTDLNTHVTASGWVLEAATGINDHGRIIGTGSFNGYPRAFMLVPRCGVADIVGLGATPPADGILTPDDLVAYLAAFFAGDVLVADIASLGGALNPDGQVTVDDLVAYLAAFFAGCP